MGKRCLDYDVKCSKCGKWITVIPRKDSDEEIETALKRKGWQVEPNVRCKECK